MDVPDYPDGCPMKRMKLDIPIAKEEPEDVPISDPPSATTPTTETTPDEDIEVDKAELPEDSDDEGDDASSQSDFGEEDLENMLDEGLPDDLKNKKHSQREEKLKVILEERGRNHFEVLPEGWVQITHNCGVPVYLHKPTRVCCVARPYFLGPGSVRRHEIPVSSVPCLSYRKALDAEAEEAVRQKELQEQRSQAAAANEDPSTTSQARAEVLPIPNAKIETVTENLKAHSLTGDQLREYCKKLFLFKTIRVMRFKSWSARRQFNKNKRQIKNLQRPTLPDGTKLITFPVVQADSSNPVAAPNKKEWIMNPNGKSYVCILHEYVQHALKKQPSYEFKELENAATPYSAIVSINGLKYGTGYGTSKKQAKCDAARETLEILIPQMKDKIVADNSNNANVYRAPRPEAQDMSVFDEIKIEDPRVAEFCAKTTEPSPHTILLTCLQRNFGMTEVQIDYKINNVKHKKNEFTMVVGKHTAKVVCKNKRDGKQRASQAILQLLHPHISNWGSLLKLYGNRSVKTFREKKQEEQEITVLQSKAAINQPNYAILDKLKSEMTKLMDKEASDPASMTTGPGTLNLMNIDL